MNENKEIKEINEKELTLMSKLQKKKNSLRKELSEKGILPKGAHNDYDNYDYFSEAQYKELFIGLFSNHGLEFDSTEIDIQSIPGTEKQPFGVVATMKYIMTDMDTGYSIESIHSGLAIDKGDKAIYKAKTGALKSFFASTFLVATKDDPERDDDKSTTKKTTVTNRSLKGKGLTVGQHRMLKSLFANDIDELKKILAGYKKKKIEELTIEEASAIIDKKKEVVTNE